MDYTRLNDEHFCVAERVETETGPRDEMKMLVELAAPEVDADAVRRDVEERRRNLPADDAGAVVDDRDAEAGRLLGGGGAAPLLGATSSLTTTSGKMSPGQRAPDESEW